MSASRAKRQGRSQGLIGRIGERLSSEAALAIRRANALAHAEDKMGWLKRKIDYLSVRNSVWREFNARLPKEELNNQTFDQRYGTDTAEGVTLVRTGVPFEDAARGNIYYRAFWESDFREVLSELNLDFGGFTFVDVGSGKGKLLLLASDYPFTEIVGVEYSPGLHAIAERNIAAYRSPSQRCTAIKSILGDALQYQLPEGPIVCLIFNAFDPSTMQAFLRRTEADICQRDHAAYVVYVNLRHIAEIDYGFDGLMELKHLKRTKTFVIFGNMVASEQFRRA